MDDHLIVIFQTEVELQCRFVLFGAAQLEQARQADAAKVSERDAIEHDAEFPIDDWDQEDWDEYWSLMEQAREVELERRALDTMGRAWFALQSILTAAANLSKLLWGSGDDPTADPRRAPLRASVGVADDSPLRLSPKVRNQFEHIDQKIDQRFTTLVWRLYFGRNMGPYDHLIDYRAKPSDYFGHWDWETGIVTFWDITISIPDIVAEVARIHPIVERKVLGPFGRE